MLPLPELLDEVLEASGYRAMLADGSEEGEDRWANLLELRAVTTRYDDLSPEDALDRLLEETALVADQDSYEGEKDAVTLITLHAAKGLEFPVVFIGGPGGGRLPAQPGAGRRARAGGGAAARVRGHHAGEAAAVPVSHAWRRATWGGGGMSIPSRFLMEIPAELMVGPQLRGGGGIGADLDPDLVFRERGSRLGAGIRAGGGAYRQGSGRPGAPAPGEPFRPSRDLGREAGRLRGRGAVGVAGAAGRRHRRPSRATGGIPAWDEESDASEAGRRAPRRPGSPGARRHPAAARSSRASAATATATGCATRAGATAS